MVVFVPLQSRPRCLHAATMSALKRLPWAPVPTMPISAIDGLLEPLAGLAD